MNEKITLPALVSFLAEKSGKPKKQCEDFLREFFNVVAETLCEGESIKAKGLGTFKIITVEARKSVNVNTGEEMQIPSHRKLVFSPSKELAEAVNAPFSMFETVEIPGDADTDFTEIYEETGRDAETLKETEAPLDNNLQEPVHESAPVIEPREEYNYTTDVTDETGTIEEPEITTHSEADTDSESQSDNVTETDIADSSREYDRYHDEITSYEKSDTPCLTEPEAPVMDTDSDPQQESAVPLPITDETPNIQRSCSRFRFLTGFVCGLLAATLACACIWYFYLRDETGPEKETINAEKVIVSEIRTSEEDTVKNQPSDSLTATGEAPQGTISPSEAPDNHIESAETVPTQPSDKVYDTISKTRYLTTMAKEYYGNYNLWPYIYEENKAILGHPDRIKPGTRVVVPPLSKYGVDPNNPEDIKRAKQKGVEIYSRYR